MISAASALAWASRAVWMDILGGSIGMWQDKKKGPQRGLRTCDRRQREGLPSYRYRPPNKYEAHAAHRSCSQIVVKRHATLRRGRQETLNRVRRASRPATSPRRGKP